MNDEKLLAELLELFSMYNKRNEVCFSYQEDVDVIGLLSDEAGAYLRAKLMLPLMEKELAKSEEALALAQANLSAAQLRLEEAKRT